MAINRETFIARYTDEVSENVATIDSCIMKLKKDPDNEDVMNTLLRTLHTIKGSSRMLKFNTIEKIAHGMENVCKGIREGRYGITTDIIKLVFITTDYLNLCLDTIRETKNDDVPVKKLLVIFDKIYANEYYSLDELHLEKPVTDAQQGQGADSPAVRQSVTATGSAQGEETAGKRPLPAARVPSGEESVRINLSKINTIIKKINNVVVRQFQFKTGNDQMREIEEGFADFLAHYKVKSTQQGRDIVQEKTVNNLLKQMQKFRKTFSEELLQLERETFEVQEEILSLNMMPLDIIFTPLEKMVEKTALSLNKEIDFTISGSDIMIDKVILEHIQDPIIHLVRNSIDHGIESEEERTAAGKPGAGRLRIDCSSESGTIIIKIQDDGKGLDYESIRKRAIELEPALEDEIRFMDNASLNAYLFMSGFSTQKQVSELSGRGVGLDIVKHNIEKVKGKISISSEKGQGTVFGLSLPLSLATVEGFFITAAGEKFLIPSNFVKEISIIYKNDVIDLLNRKAIKLREHIVPVYRLANILDKDEWVSDDTEKMFVIIVESLGEMVGVIVDSIQQYTSLIYKPLPRNVSKLKVVQGIVFDESFNIINILYMPEIIKRFKSIRNIAQKKRFSEKSAEFKNILIVDDSPSTRDVQKSILEFENYRVVTAVDGIDGLEKLNKHHINLIITDLHMPRMDGFTFIENVRRDEAHSGTPIIVITSIKDPETEEKITQAGANRYMLKAEFDRDVLLQQVKNFIG